MKPIDIHATIVSVAGIDVAYSFLDIGLVFEKLLERSSGCGYLARASGCWRLNRAEGNVFSEKPRAVKSLNCCEQSS